MKIFSALLLVAVSSVLSAPPNRGSQRNSSAVIQSDSALSTVMAFFMSLMFSLIMTPFQKVHRMVKGRMYFNPSNYVSQADYDDVLEKIRKGHGPYASSTGDYFSGGINSFRGVRKFTLPPHSLALPYKELIKYGVDKIEKVDYSAWRSLAKIYLGDENKHKEFMAIVCNEGLIRNFGKMYERVDDIRIYDKVCKSIDKYSDSLPFDGTLAAKVAASVINRPIITLYEGEKDYNFDLPVFRSLNWRKPIFLYRQQIGNNYQYHLVALSRSGSVNDIVKIPTLRVYHGDNLNYNYVFQRFGPKLLKYFEDIKCEFVADFVEGRNWEEPEFQYQTVPEFESAYQPGSRRSSASSSSSSGSDHSIVQIYRRDDTSNYLGTNYSEDDLIRMMREVKSTASSRGFTGKTVDLSLHKMFGTKQRRFEGQALYKSISTLLYGNKKEFRSIIALTYYYYFQNKRMFNFDDDDVKRATLKFINCDYGVDHINIVVPIWEKILSCKINTGLDSRSSKVELMGHKYKWLILKE